MEKKDYVKRKNGSSRRKPKPKDVDVQGKGYKNGNDVFQIAENDPIWWCKYPTLVKDAANLPYSWPTGPSYWSNTNEIVPSVMKLNTYIAPGISKDSTSPANIAARRIYAFVRSANSGAKNYAPQDMIQYLLAMDSVYACIAYLRRIYGTVNLYSPENRFVPKYLMSSMGVDYDDVSAHIPDLRALINLLIYKAASFAVPSDMGLFERHIQLFSNYYSDYNNARAQMYYYHPARLFVWDEANGELLPIQTPSVGTFANLKAFAESIINPISASETASIMTGDILKACGDRIIKLAPMAEDYVAVPMYSVEVLNQIHNTVILNGIQTSSDKITQNAAGDTLIYNPTFGFTTAQISMIDYLMGRNWLIDTPFEEPSPALNMVLTRDAYTVHSISGTGTYELDSCGTEFVSVAGIFYVDDTDTLQQINFATADSIAYSVNGMLGYSQIQTLLSKFDWAPAVACVYTDTNSNVHAGTFTRDVTKYTIVTPDILARLHEVALLSAFVSPAVAETSGLK